jgi:meso-butanediol dehydrogenase/(S,S)-butanediol dehydrogenase/diacetyl reductase
MRLTLPIKMWEVLDEAIGKKQGLAKGAAFEKSVEARSAFKRASVRLVCLRPDGYLIMT